jgi:hypothetical protein
MAFRAGTGPVLERFSLKADSAEPPDEADFQSIESAESGPIG